MTVTSWVLLAQSQPTNGMHSLPKSFAGQALVSRGSGAGSSLFGPRWGMSLTPVIGASAHQERQYSNWPSNAARQRGHLLVLTEDHDPIIGPRHQYSPNEAADDLFLGFPFVGAAFGVVAGALVAAEAGEH